MGEGDPITGVTAKEDTSLGGRLRAVRLAAGLSQQALAEKAGLVQGTVSMLESGTRAKETSADVLLRLAKALAVRPQWLLWGKGPMKEGADSPAASLFRARYSENGLELVEGFERIEDEAVKEQLFALFQSKINAALQGLPTTPDEYERPRAAVPKPAPPAPSRTPPEPRQSAPSEGSTGSPPSSRRRGR